MRSAWHRQTLRFAGGRSPADTGGLVVTEYGNGHAFGQLAERTDSTAVYSKAMLLWLGRLGLGMDVKRPKECGGTE